MAVVTVKVPSTSLRLLWPEEDEEGVREVGVGGVVSSRFTCGGLRNEASE